MKKNLQTFLEKLLLLSHFKVRGSPGRGLFPTKGGKTRKIRGFVKDVIDLPVQRKVLPKLKDTDTHNPLIYRTDLPLQKILPFLHQSRGVSQNI